VLGLSLGVLQQINDLYGATIDKQQDTKRITQGNSHQTSDLNFI
jgi:hypothetical protein